MKTPRRVAMIVMLVFVLCRALPARAEPDVGWDGEVEPLPGHLTSRRRPGRC